MQRFSQNAKTGVPSSWEPIIVQIVPQLFQYRASGEWLTFYVGSLRTPPKTFPVPFCWRATAQFMGLRWQLLAKFLPRINPRSQLVGWGGGGCWSVKGYSPPPPQAAFSRTPPITVCGRFRPTPALQLLNCSLFSPRTLLPNPPLTPLRHTTRLLFRPLKLSSSFPPLFFERNLDRYSRVSLLD